MTTNQKHHLKSDFALLQTSSILFSFHLICYMLAPSSGVESESTVSEFRETEKENFCAVFTNSIERAREIRKSNVGRKKKSVMQVQSCCFANINLSFFFFCRSRCCCRRPSLLKLFIVVIQNFCYHGNVTSPFSSLFLLYKLPYTCTAEE